MALRFVRWIWLHMVIPWWFSRRDALHFLSVLLDIRLNPNSISYCNAISACSRGEDTGVLWWIAAQPTYIESGSCPYPWLIVVKADKPKSWILIVDGGWWWRERADHWSLGVQGYQSGLGPWTSCWVSDLEDSHLQYTSGWFLTWFLLLFGMVD